MKHHPQPSGLRRGLDLLIDPDWSVEQAAAVIEPLGDLRERIWAHYELELHQYYREQHQTPFDPTDDNPPF